ncbi:MAG: 4Fe-4S binding protein, partial [Methanoregula sp.]
MAFSVHVNMERCTGCGNCVIACPVDALELYTVDPATKEKIYAVKNGKS